MTLTADMLDTLERQVELAPPPMLERFIELVRRESRTCTPDLRAHAAALLIKMEHRLRCERVERAQSVCGEMLAPWIVLNEQQSQAA